MSAPFCKDCKHYDNPEVGGHYCRAAVSLVTGEIDETSASAMRSRNGVLTGGWTGGAVLACGPDGNLFQPKAQPIPAALPSDAS
jgi:hypothetical protein